MRSTDMAAERDQQQFARDAAAAFAKDPQKASYGDLSPGSLLALRWGMTERGVLVLKLDEDFEPVNYRDFIHV